MSVRHDPRRWSQWRRDLLSNPSQSGPEPELEALTSFEVAPAELLASRALLRRTDSKFVLPRSALIELLRSLQPHFSVVLSNESRVAHYRTLYFDDEDFDFLRQHRRGRRARHKVRIREYTERGLAFLEIKTKDKHNVTSKLRVQREPNDFELRPDDRTLIAETTGPIAHRLRKSVWIDFPRVTLVGRDTNERITLDLGLTVRTDTEQLELPALAIVELKQPRFGPRTPGMRAIRAHRVRPKRFSKYCAAVSLIKGDPRAHRIAPHLREIVRLHNAR